MTKLYLNSKLIPGAVREAKGFVERMAGLIGKKDIEEGFFLLFKRCNSIHTFFMSADIDVVMFDKNGVVQNVTESLKPWSFAACMAAADTLEMKSGSAAKHGIKKGGMLTFS